MAETTETTLVTNCDGNPRSGKDSSGDHLAEQHGLPVIEAGRLYRHAAVCALGRGTIHSQMPPERISNAIQQVDPHEFAADLRETPAYIEKHGLAALYEPQIEAVVAAVADTAVAQGEVGNYICETIGNEVKAGTPAIVTVGRGLAKKAELAGAKVLLDVFMSCTPETAAQRECLRSGINPFTAEGQQVYRKLQKRMIRDATRPLNPVKPAANAESFTELAEKGYSPRAIGRIAAAEGVQIAMTTDQMPLDVMKNNIGQMFEGAMRQAALTSV